MTAKTSQHLADVLRAAGFTELAIRAEADEFHDFFSTQALPDIALDRELVAIVRDDARSERERMAAHHIRQRHHDGEFDASREESDQWAESAEGRAAAEALLRYPLPH